MKKILFLAAIYSLVFGIAAHAQNKKNEHRLTFSEWAAYYSNGKETYNLGAGGNTSSPLGNTVGLLAYLSAPYKDYNDDELVLGWNANFGAGWNVTKGKVARYNADIGFWSSKLINKYVEVGAQYSFLGVYCYQNISFLGSSFQAAVRVTDVQATYSREGEGVFIGWLKPKFPNSSANSIGAKYFIGKNVFVGGRYTSYKFNKEYAIVAGLTSF